MLEILRKLLNSILDTSYFFCQITNTGTLPNTVLTFNNFGLLPSPIA